MPDADRFAQHVGLALGAVRSQQDHHVLVTFEEGTRQRRVACFLLRTEVGTLRDQQLRHLLVVLLDRWKQRRHSGLILRIVDVGALGDQQLGDRSVAGVGSRVQGREAARVASVDGGAFLDQKLDDLLLPREGRKDQWRLAPLALRVDFRPVADQHAHLLEIAVTGGVMERSGESAAGKEHEQSHGNLNHFAPSHHLRLRHSTALHKGFARLFPSTSPLDF